MTFRSDLETLILASLEDGAKFGFDIGRHIKGRSQNGLKLGEGQLYPILHRLERQKLVIAKWEMPEGETPRKVYEITQEGRGRLAKGRQDWKAFVSGVEGVLGSPSMAKEPGNG